MSGTQPNVGDVIGELAKVIEGRRNADPSTSYVAKLFSRGTAKIAQKVGEEAVEVALASVGGGSKDEIVSESADLLFHLMVLWADRGITAEDVTNELARREGVSGITEKLSRQS